MNAQPNFCHVSAQIDAHIAAEERAEARAEAIEERAESIAERRIQRPDQFEDVLYHLDGFTDDAGFLGRSIFRLLHERREDRAAEALAWLDEVHDLVLAAMKESAMAEAERDVDSGVANDP